MTKRKVIEMLTAKAECIRRESSGIDVDCNFRNCDECDLCYKQGTMGDQMEALCVAISALQAQDLQPICNELAKDTISRQAAIDALIEEFKRTPTVAIRAKHVIEQLPSALPDLEEEDIPMEYFENGGI